MEMTDITISLIIKTNKGNNTYLVKVIININTCFLYV